MKLKPLFAKLGNFELLFLGGLLIFSWILMWKTFSTAPNGNMQIATKAWSDFAATIPLIRSFSYGSNFPPQYPIFAGPTIRYHFAFYFLVGMLEKIGLPISWALNLPSILGFFALLAIIYFSAKYFFKSKAVGILSCLFFLFNGSLSFLEFFKKNPLSANTFSEIIKNTAFPSFGPYDGRIVSAFWNLNIYTNQRHLSLAYAFFLFLLLYFYRKSERRENFSLGRVIIFGTIIGLFPFIHLAVFGMIEILLGILFLFFPKIRKEVFFIGLLSVLLAAPQILYMGRGTVSVQFFKPGYLVQNLTFSGFLNYWFQNLGLASILGPLGFLIADRKQRKLALPFLALFLAGNLFQFSPEIAANHKFFNLFAIGLNMFSALFLVRTWNKGLFPRAFVPLLIFFMVLSGLIDLFPIFNDSFITIEDIPNNKIATFIKESTPPNAVFMNSSFLYNPASIAGRKIYLGWPYFAWSAGYDTNARGRKLIDFYSSHSKDFICKFLIQNDISYFTTEDTTGNSDFPKIDLLFFKNNFISIYSQGDYSIYETRTNCSNEKLN